MNHGAIQCIHSEQSHFAIIVRGKPRQMIGGRVKTARLIGCRESTRKNGNRLRRPSAGINVHQHESAILGLSSREIQKYKLWLGFSAKQTSCIPMYLQRSQLAHASRLTDSQQDKEDSYWQYNTYHLWEARCVVC